MRKWFGVSIIMFCINFLGISQTANDILGKWYTTDKGAIIEIYKKEHQYYGKFIWLEEPNNGKGTPKVDKNNPNSVLQSRTIMGMDLLMSFTFDNEKRWEEGKIYNPEDGKIYDAYIELSNKDLLELTGYMGFTWMGKTVVWTRVK